PIARVAHSDHRRLSFPNALRLRRCPRCPPRNQTTGRKTARLPARTLALVTALLCFARLGLQARLLGLRLLRGDVALRGRLLLLRLALAPQLVAAAERAGSFLYLALDVFDDAACPGL